MSEMVERVAAALQREWAEQVGSGYGGFGANSLARAAIAAMREPTEGMCKAGDEADIGLHVGEGVRISYFGGLDDLKNIWHAMNDEALKENSTKDTK